MVRRCAREAAADEMARAMELRRSRGEEELKRIREACEREREVILRTMFVRKISLMCLDVFPPFQMVHVNAIVSTQKERKPSDSRKVNFKWILGLSMQDCAAAVSAAEQAGSRRAALEQDINSMIQDLEQESVCILSLA